MLKVLFCKDGKDSFLYPARSRLGREGFLLTRNMVRGTILHKMPHPRELVDALLGTTQLITSPETPKSERTRLLSEYREYLIWVFARFEQIHTRLLEFIYQNPDSNFDEVEEELRSLDLDEGELQLVWSIYGEFHSRRENRNKALEFIEATTQPFVEQFEAQFGSLTDEMMRDFAMRSLFGALTTVESPEGDIQFVDLPFAIGIRFSNKDDIETIEGGVDVLARYIDNLKISEEVERVPVIIIGPDCDESSLIHEETHGINASIYAGLLFEDVAEDLWGGDIRDETTLQEAFGDVNSHSDQEIVEVVEQLMPRILANAKDEVIAYFNAEDNFTTAITLLWQEHVTDDLKPEDNVVYDYLTYLGLKPELFSSGHRREIFNLIVDQFNDTLLRNVGFLRQLWGAVKFENSERVSKSGLISFMRFVPLSQWQRLGRHVFSNQLHDLSESIQTLEDKMNFWFAQATLLEEEYRVYSLLANGMGIDAFAEQAYVGTREIKKISAEVVELVEAFQNLVPLIEEGIGKMKDLSLRHDLFDEQELFDLATKIQGYFFELIEVRDQLNPHVLKSVRFKN